MAAPFKHIITDMDGTLLSPDHFMTDYTRDTLKTLVHEHGVTLIMATGRNSADIKIVSRNLRKHIWGDNSAHDGASKAGSAGGDVRPPAMYLLTSNGAVAHNAVTDELIFQNCVDPVSAEKLYRLMPDNEKEVNTNIYQQDDWICRIDWPEMMSVHKESGIQYIHVPKAPPRSVKPVPSTAPSGLNRGVAVGDYNGISKIFFIADSKDRLQTLAEEVQEIAVSSGGSPTSLTFSASNCMDVMAEGVCKGQGLRQLFEIVLQPKEGHDVVAEALHASIAFGDGLNDAEMLTEVGKGCVMGNATPKLIERHPELEVVLPNSEDGVAKKLRSVFSIPL